MQEPSPALPEQTSCRPSLDREEVLAPSCQKRQLKILLYQDVTSLESAKDTLCTHTYHGLLTGTGILLRPNSQALRVLGNLFAELLLILDSL